SLARECAWSLPRTSFAPIRRGRGSSSARADGTDLSRPEHKHSVDAPEAIPREPHRLVVASVPQRRLIAPVLRSRLTGFALWRDRERVIEIGKVGDHP